VDPSLAPATHPLTHFEAGLRVGFAGPIDFQHSGEPPSGWVSLTFPIRLELGTRLGQRVFAGVLGQYGFGAATGEICAEGASCSAHTIELGAETIFHTSPEDRADVWFGLAGGWEEFSWSTSSSPSYSRQPSRSSFVAAPRGSRSVVSMPGGDGYTDEFAGWFVELQLGLDLRVSPVVRAGPWLGFSLGEYVGDPYSHGLHGWLGGGVRLAIVP
jgi:hypothetical protein